MRYTCGRVLVGMRERNPRLHFDSALAVARAQRELQNLSAFDRRRLEHTFNVLALTFPREPMQLAYAAVTADDPYLRGVALEYLDATLPADLREGLSPHLEPGKKPRSQNHRADGRSRVVRRLLLERLRSEDE